MGSSEEKCIGTFSIIVEPLDEDGGAVESVSSARNVVEDVVEGSNFLRRLLLCKGLKRLLLR